MADPHEGRGLRHLDVLESDDVEAGTFDGSESGRLRSQHTTARFSQFILSCFLASAGSSADPCSQNRNSPPGRSTR